MTSRVIAGLMLVVLAPWLLLLALLTRWLQGKPVLYRQQRIGYALRPFELLKFRTMRAAEQASQVTVEGDPRITRWGCFLRASKLDELPQLLNIVRGDMCFIGPRPEVAQYVTPQGFAFLQRIKPGLSDFACVLLRNEAQILARAGGVARYAELLQLKLRLADLYEQRRSVLLNVRLVGWTIIALLWPPQAQRRVVRYLARTGAGDVVQALKPWL